MENLIFAIIIFVVIAVIQFFIKRASKTDSQGSKQNTFSSIFEQIKNEFKETANEYNVKEKTQNVYNDEIKKTDKQVKEERVDQSKTFESIEEVKENNEQFSSLESEPHLSPIDRINNLPSIQSAVIWKEILDQP